MSYNYTPNPQPPRYDGGGYGDTMALTSRVSQAMKAVYLKMTFALLVTGLLSYFLSYTGSDNPDAISTFNYYVLTHRWVMWVTMLASLGIVMAISGAINKISSPVATALFYLLAVLYGLWLAPLFVIYTKVSIAKTFFITAGTFGAMSIYGYTTKADLTKFGNILFMALIGLVIAMIVNIFTKSSAFGWIISVCGVLIFVGLTAWDTQQIKNMAQMMPPSQLGRLGTIGALNLYLDFINLFLFLLRFFGSSRD